MIGSRENLPPKANAAQQLRLNPLRQRERESVPPAEARTITFLVYQTGSSVTLT